MREGIAEKAGDAADHVDPRPSELLEWNRLDADQPSIFRLPARANAEQGEHLAEVVAVRAHGARPPDADADALGVAALVLKMPLQQLVGQLLADLLSGDTWQGTRFDGVEVTPGRQDVGHAAGRRTAGPGRHEVPVEGGEQVVDLLVV